MIDCSSNFKLENEKDMESLRQVISNLRNDDILPENIRDVKDLKDLKDIKDIKDLNLKN